MTATPSTSTDEVVPAASPTGAAPPFANARQAALALGRSASVGRVGLLLIGAIVCVQDVLRLTSLADMGLTIDQRFRLILTALLHLTGFGLAGWLLGKSFEAAGHLLGLFVEYADAASRLERPLIRLAEALERPRGAAEPPAVGTAPDGPESLRAAVRDAIETGRWRHAESLVQSLQQEHPDEPEGPRLAEQLAEARRQAADALQGRLEAARKINDAELALDLRDSLAQIVRDDSLHALDRDLASWLMDLIQKRLRSGTMAADVALIAGRVVESFESTPEAASLRAALPTLRRSAGLCARCAQPYRGIADACPKCLAAVSFPIFGPAGGDETQREPELPVNGRTDDDENPFLDKEG